MAPCNFLAKLRSMAAQISPRHFLSRVQTENTNIMVPLYLNPKALNSDLELEG